MPRRVVDAIAGRAPLPSDDATTLADVTSSLLERLLAEAHIDPTAVLSVIAAAPEGTRSGFPATAVRHAGLEAVPVMGVAGLTPMSGPGDVQLLIHHLVAPLDDKN